jgi:uncharacterized paraquat-inducible protein A
MPHKSEDFDDDDGLDDGFPDEDEDAADGDTIACPHCGAEIYEDAVRCPECEQYLSDEERTTTNQPRWVAVTAILLLALLTAFFLLG